MLPLQVAGGEGCGSLGGGRENASRSGVCEKVRGVERVGTGAAIQLGIVSLA